MSDYSPSPKESPQIRKQLPIPEIYQIHKGNSGDWGIEGYEISKRPQLLVIKESQFPKDKKVDMISLAMKRSKDPDCSKYSPTIEQLSNRYWKPNNGRFPKAQKKTYLDDSIKQGPKTPGPGTYFSLEKGQSESPRKSPLGKMAKGEVISFLSTTEFYAEQTPSPGQYFSSSDTREKAVNII